MNNTIDQKILKYEVDKDGVAIITVDMQDYPTNVLNDKTIPAILQAARIAIADTNVKGVILTSGKKDFIAGADLKHFIGLTDKEMVFNMVMEMNQGFIEMETSGKPFVAAINGNTLGGGYEVALGCHYRVAVNNAGYKIGLPEVTLGLLPGGGGTQRLPRIIGIEKALQIIIQGQQLRPDEALKQGLVNELVATQEDLLPAAKKWILEKGTAEQPWNVKGYRIPGGEVMSPKVAQTFGAGVALTRGKTKGNFPSAQYAMSCVFEGMQLPMERAVIVEARYFVKSLFSKEAHNIIRTGFFNIGKANKGTARPKGIEPFSFEKVAILGAGMMGAGIAYVSAKAGIACVLKDVTQESADKGKDYSTKLLDKAVSRGYSTEEKKNKVLDLITATDKVADLAGCDLVIEAVFESRDLKATVTKETEAVMKDNAIFASNTSTLPITGLAEASKKAENFIGLHFFSPVDKMPLVEIIMGEKTSDYALAAAIDYVLKIKKTPIVVNDSRGFFTSRVFSTFTNEGMGLLLEGTPAPLIENAALNAGMPVGPLAVTDEVNLGLVQKIVKQTEKDLGKKDDSAASKIADLFVDKLDRPGKRQGKGFYEYPENGKKHLWNGLNEHFPVKAGHPTEDEIKTRYLSIMALETYRCLEEGVLRAPEDGDIGSILGFGFPIYTGGAISYIDYVGAQQFVENCDGFAQKYGARFEVPDSLREKARKSEKVGA
jgi:3-hydroxyacyl-CoA dehydrogenase/enoyl-CoA hydratase/3-hydroxybutyryl-CoA epimerase